MSLKALVLHELSRKSTLARSGVFLEVQGWGSPMGEARGKRQEGAGDRAEEGRPRGWAGPGQESRGLE